MVTLREIMVEVDGKNSQRGKAQPNSKSGAQPNRNQVPTTASPSNVTSPESSWEINLRIARQDDDSAIWSNHCIYRVPEYLRVGVNKVYLPRIVSLGPYHHNKKRLRNMDRHKWRAVYQILKRYKQNINSYRDTVKELEERARACYEGQIFLSSDQFVEMMVLDGCFILELFRGVADFVDGADGFGKLGYSESDPIFSMRGSMHLIQDMIMLENQIPLFVLDGLFRLQPEHNGDVSKLALIFFDPLCPTDEPSSWEMGCTTAVDPQPDVEGLHCLDVFRRSLLRTEPQPTPDTRMSDPQPSSMEMGYTTTDDPQPGVEGLHCLDVFRRILLRTEPQPTPDTRMSDPQPSSMEMGYTTTVDPQPGVEGLHCFDVFRRILLRTESQQTPDLRGLHFLDVFRKFWRSLLRSEPQPTPKPSTNMRRQQLIRCVTELRESGINFKKRKEARFWDIEFKDGVLRIPRLLIDDDTKSIFLNLIAFEQRHPNSTNHITSYVMFMDNLINSAEDVSILHRCGIIENYLGSEAEVAELFNRICKEVFFDISESYLRHLYGHVNQYCEHRWNRWRATLNHKYVNNPWAVLSIIAAVFLLLLTFTQTFYGVFSYYRPPS